jgi:hypothetical protein
MFVWEVFEHAAALWDGVWGSGEHGLHEPGHV